jgi:serine protease
VLGKCGGYDSDVADGIAWLPGWRFQRARQPDARWVINVNSAAAARVRRSIGARRRRVRARRDACNRGVGRERAQDVANVRGQLSGCSRSPQRQALAASSRRSTLRDRYHAVGAGGSTNFRTPADSVIVLSNTGTTSPSPTPSRTLAEQAIAPMVSRTISLMLAVAPWLTPDPVRAILVSTAKPFPLTSTATMLRRRHPRAGAAVRAAAATPPTANYEGLWWNAPAGSSRMGNQRCTSGRVILQPVHVHRERQGVVAGDDGNQTAPNVFSGTLYQTPGRRSTPCPSTHRP